MDSLKTLKNSQKLSMNSDHWRKNSHRHGKNNGGEA